MADSDAPSPPERPNSPRNERGSSQPMFWYVAIGLLVFVTAATYFQQAQQRQRLSFSEFVSRLEEDGDLTKSNVHDLTIGLYEITFQDQPVVREGTSTLRQEPSGHEGSENADRSQSPIATAKATPVQRFTVPIMGLGEHAVEEARQLLTAKGIEINGSRPPTEWPSFLISFMMLTLLIVLMLAMFRRFGTGAAMSFGRSRGRLMSDDDVKVTFDDVAGIDEAVEELREVVEFLRTPAKYQALGGRIPRGVLLVGPPGTGKTLLAKAVAGEAGVPFFSLSGSDFVEMFVGVGAARVRDMFAQAAAKAPSIIFIDELDALGKVRGSGLPGGQDEREQTLNALLVEMDGFSSDQSVIVMGATNRPETLDPALMRPGRFDRHVLVDRPDYKGREAILKVHAEKVKLGDDVHLGRIAKLTPGFVGADLANLVNEAALLAARKDKKAVSMADFEEGIERVVAGLEKPTRIIDEEEKQRVAYHECGHALVACSLPHTDPVHKISIIPRGFGALGYTLQRPEDDRHLITQTELQNRICTLLGGIAAEDNVFQETSTGAQNDLERATDIARRMVTEFGMSPKLGRVNYRETHTSPFLGTAVQRSSGDAHSEATRRDVDLEIKRIIDECMETARDVLRRRRPVLEHMTRELIEAEVMDAEQLQRILDQHKTGPQLKPGTFVGKTDAAEDDSERPGEPAAEHERGSAEGA
ncbi:MAG: ATP-dependent zinc metalloprotease FtsH [Planctomycetaceae bacterium]|nr:ATP-dependent zinc metalloprotease FtsH [Planctomycetaceae bacterium]